MYYTSDVCMFVCFVASNTWEAKFKNQAGISIFYIDLVLVSWTYSLFGKFKTLTTVGHLSSTKTNIDLVELSIFFFN